jgi:hypothetical protein
MSAVHHPSRSQPCRVGIATFLARFLCCVFAAGTALAQVELGSVTGTLLESWEGKPLSGVTVTVRGTTLAVTSDTQGRYEVNSVPPGEHTLKFSRPGLHDARRHLVHV